MLSRLSTASLQRVVGSSALNQVSMIFNEEASRPSSAPLMVQLFSGEGPSKTRPDSTRVKLGKSAKKFLQDAERPEVLSAFPELSKMGIMKGKYGVRFQEKFAVVQLGSHQFKVTSDDVIYTEKLKDVDVMDKIKLGRVLLIGSKETTTIGRPFIPGASVWACIEEQCQDAKVIIFKKKRRKNYRKTQGHRQELTGLRILEICSPNPPKDAAKDPKIELEQEFAVAATQIAQVPSTEQTSLMT